MAYQSFEDLEVWQKAYKLSVKIYRELEHSKEYGLKDQMTRAGVSIVSNIAEGAERGSIAEFNRFLHIAKGSAAELRTQLLIARDIGVMEESIQQELLSEAASISKMLHALIRSLKTKP